MWIIAILCACLVGLVVYDLVQRKHALLRSFPIVGHFRYLLEAIGPELRQYIVTNNDEERPFSRDQRRWIYASSKKRNNYFGFGSDNDMELENNYLIIKPSVFPLSVPTPSSPDFDPAYRTPCAKVLGGFRSRLKAFRPASVVNVSAMSYGSLGARAVEAINRGCAIAGCLHNTGEGGVSRHHLHGGDLVWQIGTGYFGCRDQDGSFCFSKLVETVDRYPQIRAIEIKLSQGAKAGLGGILPAAKITEEISNTRGIPMGQDCVSPSSHSAFHDADSLLDFVERIAGATGLPVGIKSAVGEMTFWHQLAEAMQGADRGVDFITVDGGEGGTGAAPLVYSDHVAMPFKFAFTRVYRAFAQRAIHENVVFIGSGKLGLPETALFSFALGADLIAVARESMLAIGCIQAQRCHTGHCPTGIATQNQWLVRGLEPTYKAARLANYLITLRKELLQLSRTCGVDHPAMVHSKHIEVLDGRYGAKNIEELFGYQSGFGLPSQRDQNDIRQAMRKPVGVSE